MIAKFQLLSLLAASLAAASPVLDARGGLCEPLSLICYGQKGGTSQNIDTEDIEYVARFLREHGRKQKALYTMPPSFSCEEWKIITPGSGTVLALAKHVNPRTHSSVSYEDIANTIDGGENASESDKSNSLLGCGVNGGSLAVKVDLNSRLYNTEEYIRSKVKPKHIIIKLVRDPDYEAEME